MQMSRRCKASAVARENERCVVPKKGQVADAELLTQLRARRKRPSPNRVEAQAVSTSSSYATMNVTLLLQTGKRGSDRDVRQSLPASVRTHNRRCITKAI